MDTNKYEPTKAGKVAVLEEMLGVWRRTRYQAQVDYQIAQMLSNETGMEVAQKRMGDAIKTIDKLSDILAALNSDDVRDS